MCLDSGSNINTRANYNTSTKMYKNLNFINQFDANTRSAIHYNLFRLIIYSLPWCVGVLIKEVSKGNKKIYVKIRYWDKKRIMS